MLNAKHTVIEESCAYLSIHMGAPSRGDNSPTSGSTMILWSVEDYRTLESELGEALAVVRKAIAEQEARHDATV